MSEKDKKEITVIAEIMVESPTEAMPVKGFDAAWHYALKLPMPVTVKFIGWVRKDGKK